MAGYRVPARAGESLLEAKGSLFYGRTVRVESEAEVQDLLAEARAAHPEANHHAFAYRVGSEGQVARFSDDGEPGGTAGRPMMEVLLREQLVYVAVVVSRHFGGTLLGAGGLVRAYGGAAAAAVRDAGASEMRPHRRLRVTIDYALLGALQQEIRRAGLRQPEEEFADMVTLTLPVRSEQVDAFQARVGDLSAGRARVDSLDTIYLPI
ncbi:MAG TPA: YigZ family protein [Chloroflexota bacterium]|nr:YigZ family protein [Chloroflexota bacterium]